MVSSQGKDKVVLDGEFARGGLHYDMVGCNLLHRRVEVGSALAVLYPVLYIRQYPIFHVRVHLRTTMDERDPGAVPPQVQCGNRRRVLAADHQNVIVEVGMWFAIVMKDFEQVFAGNA